VLEKLLSGEPNVTGNLSQQGGRNVPASMEWDGGRATVNMTELLVGSALAGLRKTEPLEELSNLAGFEDGKRTQGLSDEDRMGSNEIDLEARLAVL